MIVVTGAAGFIGSCLVSKLNDLGKDELILVDQLDQPDKKKNIEGKKYRHYFEKDDFLEKVLRKEWADEIEAVFHLGACSSTTLQDEDYFKKNNLEYTQHLAEWAIANNIRFIYASSAATYGDGSCGYRDDDETTRTCQPLNLYGWSKQNFDLWALDRGYLDSIVGLKYFNVFGPNEYHKDDMRSVVCKAYDRVVSEGKMSLFKSYKPEYKDGEQKRDFIYVKDAVDMTLFFLDCPDVNGIFNIGTGVARTWNDLANALFSAVDKKADIEYIDMPESLRPRYQYLTQAEMDKIKQAGYNKPCFTLEESIKDYARYLGNHLYL